MTWQKTILMCVFFICVTAMSMGFAQAQDPINWSRSAPEPKTERILLMDILEHEEDQTKLEKKQLKELVRIRKALEKK